MNGSRSKRRLPPSIEAAWGVRQRAGRGPKPGLSLARIVEAGIKVASSEGLSAVSMGRVAREVGAATMALYRYVETKDELLALMIDAASQAPRATPNLKHGWRAALSEWARDQRAALRKHPWIVRVPISGPPITPNQVAWFERGLRCLRDTGLVEGEKLGVLLLVNGFIRNQATLSADLHVAARASDASLKDATAAYGKVLSSLIDPVRFPEITALVAARVFEQATGDTDFEFDFGLNRILDGVEAFVRNRTSRPR